MSAPESSYFESARGVRTLWLGILAGPLLWFLNQQVNYLLVRWACSSGHVIVLHAVAATCLVGALLAGKLALGNRRRLEETEGAESLQQERARFMVVLGICSSFLFALVIIAQGIPNFILNPCGK